MQSVQNNEVFLLHFPGPFTIPYRNKMFEIANNQKVILPNDLSIVSLLTTMKELDSPIYIQLMKSNVPFYNADDIDTITKWSHKYKPPMIANALEKVETKYSLITDSLDTVFCSDLTNLIPSYLSYGYDVVFSSTIRKFPKDQIEILKDCPNDDDRIEKYGNWCYLHPGTCIGKTEVLKKFYQQAAIFQEDIYSECPAIRKAFHIFQDQVFFDYKCKLFQVFLPGTRFSKKDPNKIFFLDNYY